MPVLMKGHSWSDRFVNVKGEQCLRFEYPVWVEPKVDDIRCRVVAVRSEEPRGEVAGVYFESYAEKPLHNLKGSGLFDEMFCRFFELNPLIHELDIGVEVNGNFNDSYRWVRSSRGLPPEKHDKKTGTTAPALYSHMVRFHLFDIPDLGDNPYSERRHFIDMITAKLVGFGLPFEQYRGVLVPNEVGVDAAYCKFRSMGYEGAMVKTRDHLYQRGKRVYGWLKLKPEDTYDGVITGLVEAVAGVDDPERGVRVGDRLGRTGAVEVRLEDGSVARPHGIAHALGTDMHDNPDKYIGQWVEFAAMERDRQGGYRHPVFRRLRESKQ